MSTSLPDRLQLQTVNVVRPAVGADGRGNETFDYGPAATRTPISCWLQQDSRSERFPDGRNPTEQLWLLMTNHQDIDANDRIEWADHPAGSLTFEVHGPVEPTYRPNSGFHHTEATLRLLEG